MRVFMEKCSFAMEKYSEHTESMAHNIQIALLDDHPVVRTGMKLSLAPTCHVAIEAERGEEFLQKMKKARVDVAVLDLMLPDMSGVDVVRCLRKEHPEVKILIFSADTREDVFEQLLEIGIDGFLSKNTPEDTLTEAVMTIVGGENYFSRPEQVLERDILVSMESSKNVSLTEREYDIMLAFCKGMSCNEIAQQMYISPKTVDNHKQHIFAKLGIHNVVQLVTYAVRNKIIVLS